jgi:sulfite exporter TauE/SafE
VGMCGAIVLAYAMPATAGGGGTARPVVLHTAYNAGRILSYALLGGLVGSLGLALVWLQMAGEIIAVVSGILMIIGGIAMLGFLPIPTSLSLGGNAPAVRRLHGRLLQQRTLGSKFLLGFLTPVLPCGILYAMLARAAASGATVDGALTMGVFGAGMAPALFALGAFSTLFSARVRRGAEIVAAVTIILMGVTLVLRGLHIPFLSFIPMGGMKHSCCS